MGILNDVGGFLGAFGESAGFGGPASSPSSGQSQSGSHTGSDGSPKGSSSDGGWWGVSEQHDTGGNIVGHTTKVGGTEYHHAGGMMGFLDSLLGGSSTGKTVDNGNGSKTHFNSSGEPVGKSVCGSDGSWKTYDNSGRHVETFRPDSGQQETVHTASPSDQGGSDGGWEGGSQAIVRQRKPRRQAHPDDPSLGVTLASATGVIVVLVVFGLICFDYHFPTKSTTAVNTYNSGRATSNAPNNRRVAGYASAKPSYVPDMSTGQLHRVGADILAGKANCDKNGHITYK